MVLTARGPEQQSKGTDTVGAWINLCLATGRAGRPLSGYGCLTGQGNGQGGREHGQKADQLPGYRKLDDPAARRACRRGVGRGPRQRCPGRGAARTSCWTRWAATCKSLLLMGSNPVVSAPRAAHIEERLRSLDFLAVADVVLSETAALADVVLPVTQWAEETGTTTNLEGRVLLRRARDHARPRASAATWRSCTRWPACWALEKGFPTDPEEVFEELRRASAGGPGGLLGHHATAGSRRRNGRRSGPARTAPAGERPPRTPVHPGTPRLFLDRFATPDGRARFVPVAHRAAAEETDAEYPVLLTTGRVVAQYQSGAQTRRVDELNAAAPGPFVELHPRLAERLGAVEGEPLAVVSRRGRAVAPGADHGRRSARTPCSCPSTGRARAAPTR